MAAPPPVPEPRRRGRLQGPEAGTPTTPPESPKARGGRPPKLHPERALEWFIAALADHPWAAAGHLGVIAGLSRWERDHVAAERASREKWIESAAVPDRQFPPKRFALTPRGAAEWGVAYRRSALADALLRARHLDWGRALLAEWSSRASRVRVVWSLSPATVPARCVMPPPRPKPKETRPVPDGGYRSIRLDALACVRYAAGRYINVAVWVDPGDVKMEWFFQQFRSMYAWARREAFRDRGTTFPLAVVVAADDLRGHQAIQLWGEATGYGQTARPLRVTARAELDRPMRERAWWSERHTRTGLWAGLLTADRPSMKPDHVANWWADPAPDDRAAVGPPGVPPPPQGGKERALGPMVKWAQQGTSQLAVTLRDHLEVGLLECALLARIGEYPLLSCAELADVLGLRWHHVKDALDTLLTRGMVRLEETERGYVLAARGMELLAAQGGYSAAEYAGVRNWPIDWEVVLRKTRKLRRPEYRIGHLIRHRRHTAMVREFLVGLRRRAREHGLRVMAWDHVNAMYEFVPPRAGLAPARRGLQYRFFPDASGVVRLLNRRGDRARDTALWLEIDRATREGLPLQHKLRMYYEALGGFGVSMVRLPRVLVVVEADDEARLQCLRRHFRDLDSQYGRRLDVLVARHDQLVIRRGQLDPMRRVWRSPYANEFVAPFSRPGEPPAGHPPEA